MHITEEWTPAETQAFSDKLRTFRDGLPERQGEAFARMLAGAAAALDVAERAETQGRAEVRFATDFARFRDDLSPKERDGFDAIVMASTGGWGVQVGRDEQLDAQGGAEGGEGVIYFGPAALEGFIIGCHIARSVAVIVAGVVTAVIEGSSDDEETLAPDLSNIPPSPETPS